VLGHRLGQIDAWKCCLDIDHQLSVSVGQCTSVRLFVCVIASAIICVKWGRWLVHHV
jgi:hypothetical protein